MMEEIGFWGVPGTRIIGERGRRCGNISDLDGRCTMENRNELLARRQHEENLWYPTPEERREEGQKQRAYETCSGAVKHTVTSRKGKYDNVCFHYISLGWKVNEYCEPGLLFA